MVCHLTPGISFLPYKSHPVIAWNLAQYYQQLLKLHHALSSNSADINISIIDER